MVHYTSILNTKLYCPKATQGLIDRERLHRQLDKSLQYPITLISAPPGYGKTVLASSWARAQAVPVAWLILDKEESSLEQFMGYLIAALNSALGGCFSATAALLATAEIPATKHIAQLLANEIDALDDELLLILDDYHQVEHSSVVHELISVLVSCPPPNLHLIILTRRDPPLPLQKLRANNQCLEIRLVDLRFSIEETTAMLRASLTSELSQAAVSNAQDVLEGWGAGLRMVILAAQQAVVEDDYLRRLAGQVQQVQEYMFDEVIKGLPRPTLHYLLCSALPRRFSAALLDAMVLALPAATDNINGHTFVHFAEHNNMFTTSLDVQAQWFRYHNLFRQQLIWRVRSTFSTDDLQAVVSRAAEWFEAAGDIDDAIRLLVEHGYGNQAVAIVDRHRHAALDADQWLALQSWLHKFPPAEVERSTVLLLTKASLAAFNLDLYLLGELVQQLDTCRSAGILSEGQQAELNFFRSLPLFWNGDIATARQCLELAVSAPLAPGQITGELYVYLSMSHAMTGSQDLALQSLSRAEQWNSGSRNVFLTRLLAAKSFVLYIALQPAGSLTEAERLIGLADADVPSEHARGWGHYMQSLNLLNTGRLDTARQAIAEALRFSEHLEKRVQIDLYLALGICHCHQGNQAGVTTAFNSLETLIEAAPTASLLVLAQSARVRLTLLGRDLLAAHEQALELPHAPTAGTLAFWLEEPCLSWAKVQIATGHDNLAQQVLPLLDLLYRQANAQHLKPSQVEIRLMQALTECHLGRMATAQQFLRGAIELALPCSWVGPFAEMGRGLSPQLLESLNKDERSFLLEATAIRGQEMHEPTINGHTICAAEFTNRESNILELLADRRCNKEIATALFISVHTVNYHLKHIYQKLEVNGRRQAVARARALGILSPDVQAP